MSDALSEVTAVLRAILQDDRLTVTAQTRFEDLPDWDPMDLISVVVEVECRCAVQFEVSEISRLLTVGDLTGTIARKRSAGQGSRTPCTRTLQTLPDVA